MRRNPGLARPRKLLITASELAELEAIHYLQGRDVVVILVHWLVTKGAEIRVPMEANDYRAGFPRQLHLPVLTGNRDRHKQLPVPRAQGDREENGNRRRHTPDARAHLLDPHAQITTVKDVQASSKTTLP